MSQLFRYCPQCAAGNFTQEAPNLYSCPHCGFHFYRNPAAAVAGIIVDDAGRVLLIRRGKDPAKGKLALPGGFIDFDETAEAALDREIKEELGLRLSSAQYLMSHPNQYPYRDVIYPVLDLFFVCRLLAGESQLQAGEVESIRWLTKSEIDLEQMAFDSMKAALRMHLRRESGSVGST